jgi:hypothetical protein
MTDFHPCSICKSYSQVNLIPLCSTPSGHQVEFSFVHPRYFFEGDRPSQTDNHVLSCLKQNLKQLVLKILESDISFSVSVID